jgi:hypothetical protein
MPPQAAAGGGGGDQSTYMDVLPTHSLAGLSEESRGLSAALCLIFEFGFGVTWGLGWAFFGGGGFWYHICFGLLAIDSGL